MSTINDIKYYPFNQIDLAKWDRCIDRSDNGLIYAHSFYLEKMAYRWDALVLNDYEAVMPLTWKRKYGFYYLYQPYFMPNLGVFGIKDSAAMLPDFIKAIPGKFRYWNIDLNEENYLHDNNNCLNLKITVRTHYQLNLNRSYSEINTAYKKLCHRMIKKAAQHNIQIYRESNPAVAIEYYRMHYQNRHTNISSETYDNLLASANLLFEKGQANVYLAKLPDGEITAAYLMLVDNKAVYFIIGGSSERGRQTGSFYLITDAAIREYAATNRIFRFEGSDIPGIAFFNEQFGARVTNYFHLNKNMLPFPFNLLKRS